MIFAVDPGSEQSALVVYDPLQRLVLDHVIEDNTMLLARLRGGVKHADQWPLVIEAIESYGMAVGAEVFRTVWWSGRFHQAWAGEAFQLPRRAVKLHLCHSARATDSNVRQAILGQFGPTKAAAVGTKRSPGPLYGIKGHEYAALAVALTWAQARPETIA